MKQTKLFLVSMLLFAALGAIGQPPPPGPPPPPPPAAVLDTFTGAVGNAWDSAGNWTAGVPNDSTNVYIPAGLTPTFRIGATLVKDVTIASGTSLNIPTGSTLNIYGNWTNHGTANVGNGYVHEVSGSNITFYGYTSFNNLTIAGDAAIGTNTGDHIDVRGVLELDGGSTLTTNGSVVLTSTATQTACIYANGGALSGNITMQRYISGPTGYRDLSSPMTDATVSTWASSFNCVIRGTDGVQASLPGQEGTIQAYVEPANTTTSLNNGYYNYTGNSDPLTSGRGFPAYLTTLPVTIKTTGTAASGPISYLVTNSPSANATVRGWNFAGNPYPSPISWTAVKAANSNSIYGTCYIWKTTGGTAGSWQAYNGTTGTNGVGNVIASSQGFLIKTTATTQLSFTNAMRTQDITTVFNKANEMQDNEVRIAISSATDEGSEAVAYTTAGATDGLDMELDGTSPPLPTGIESPTIAYTIGGESYLIHATDAITESTVMPLSVHTGVAGTYYINATALNVSGLPVYLYDNVKGTYTDLNTETASLTTQGDQNIDGRYSVVFSKKAAAATADNNIINIYGKTAAITIERAADGSPATIIITNLLGQQVVNIITTNSTLTLPIDISNAMYIVSVKQAGNETVKKVMVK